MRPAERRRLSDRDYRAALPAPRPNLATELFCEFYSTSPSGTVLSPL